MRRKSGAYTAGRKGEIFFAGRHFVFIGIAIVIGLKKQKDSEQPTVSRGINKLLNQQKEDFDLSSKCE